jgi:ATP-dependent protease ClpP protease subunit
MFLSYLFYCYGFDNILLNKTNNLILKGAIDQEVTTEFIYEFNKINDKIKNKTYIYLDTPGGSVQEGMKIVTLIKNYNLSCIAERAYSMGFIIFQTCKKRYILQHSSLMQHQMSLGIMNEKGKIDSYMKYINEIEDELTAIQASKLLLSRNQFRNKTVNEWWMYGENILKYRAADEIIKIECDSALTKSTFTKEYAPYIYTYSKCPLVNGPVKKEKKKGYEQMIYFM